MSSLSRSAYALTPKLLKKARFLAIAGDQTRIRILCYMFENKKACVSDLANALKMTVSAISHHLQIMRDNGFFETERKGNTICYILVENDDTRKLGKIVCE